MNRPPRLPSLPLPKSLRRGLLFLILALSMGFALILGTTPRATAQVTPLFPCDGTFFFSQGTAPAPVLLNTINTALGTFNPSSFAGFSNAGNIDFNALGYNVQDGNLYAVRRMPTLVSGSTYRYTVYRVTNTGIVTLGTVDVALPAPVGGNAVEAFAGDFDAAGNLVVVTNTAGTPANGANIFRFSVSSLPVTTINATQLPVPSGGVRPFVPDIGFNPSDGRFYGIDRGNSNRLISFAFNGTTVSGLTLANITYPTGYALGPFGASFFDVNGDFYAYRNSGTGSLIRVTNITGSPIATELSGNPGASQRNDGAACAFAPSFQKSVVPTTANAGDIVTYTYTVRNRTTIALNNITFTDPLGNGRTFVGAPTFVGFTGTPNVTFGAGNSSITVTNINLPAAPAPPTTITTATITIQVRIPNNLPTGTIFNQASLVGTIGGTPTEVDSQSDFAGTDAFPDPTPLNVVAQGLIGVAKAAGTPLLVSPGVFDVPFTIRVQNYGGTRLTNAQVQENLRATFLTAPNAATAASLQVAPTICATGGLGPGNMFQDSPVPTTANAINPTFNGSLPIPPPANDNNLLQTAAVNLQPGDFFDICYTVRVTPGAVVNYTNQVTASGRDPNNALVQDLSQNGNDNSNNPDPDGDGNPLNNDVPTPISFPIAIGRIGTAKRAGTPMPVVGSPGVFDVTYTILVENFGTVNLSSVQVIEDLNNTFLTPPPTPVANAAVLQVAPAISASGNRGGGPLQGTNTGVNGAYNGGLGTPTNTNLLAPGFVLAPRDFVEISFTVRVTPGTSLLYENQVTATGNDPGGNPVPADASVNVPPGQPLNADPDNDGNPNNNASNTPVNFAVGRIGTAKRAGTPMPVVGSPGVFDVTYTILVENFGTVNLSSVQVIEDLNNTFLTPPPTPVANAAVLQVAPAISASGNRGGGPLQGTNTGVNGAYNGGLGTPTNTNLLAPGFVLAPRDFVEISFTVRVTPGTSLLYENQVTATGNDPGGNPVPADASVNVPPGQPLNADPDNDGNPNNNASRTPVSFVVNLQILKRITNVAGPTYPGGFFTGVEGVGTPAVDAMQAAGVDPVGRQTVSPGDGSRSVQAGDTIQYRIYFVNPGGVGATNVRFCDRIPDGTTYVAGSLQIANPAPAAANAFIAAGTDVPVPPCVGAVTNPNGAVVTDPITVAGNTAGFVQFSVTVNP